MRRQAQHDHLLNVELMPSARGTEGQQQEDKRAQDLFKKVRE
jgi:hypothetical protein